jgi:hypothetical protein
VTEWTFTPLTWSVKAWFACIHAPTVMHVFMHAWTRTLLLLCTHGSRSMSPPTSPLLTSNQCRCRHNI